MLSVVLSMCSNSSKNKTLCPGGGFSPVVFFRPVSLQLPRHKSVVVSLNDSDDSDSDVDASSSSQAMFGGLEFMIKEARRTVEVGHILCWLFLS